MAADLKGRSLLTLKDFNKEEIRWILDLAHQVKEEKRSGKKTLRLVGKNLAMIFEKLSTRTRCAFETAFAEEGGHPVMLSKADIHLGTKETIADTARVLGRMFSGISFRGFKQETVRELFEFSGIPVYNALTDDYHPTQALADIMTVEECFNNPGNRRIVYIGDGRNNVANSLLIICSKLGISCSIIAPPSLQPDDELINYCKTYADANNSGISVSSDIEQGIKGADVIYTDVWISMGEEEKKKERISILKPYQVNDKLLEMTGKPDTVFLHCLPAVRGNEVTDSVMDGKASRVWDQAENRKHTIKAIILSTML
jgi:ornithine carbamoyltransferase